MSNLTHLEGFDHPVIAHHTHQKRSREMLRITPIIRFASDAAFRSVLFTPAGMTFMHIGVWFGLLVRPA